MKKHYINLMLMACITTTSRAKSYRLPPLPFLKSLHMLTLNLKIFSRLSRVPLYLSLFIATCALGQEYQLQRTWMMERRAALNERTKTLAVQKSGNRFAEIHKTVRGDGRGAVDVFLYGRTTAMIMGWPRSFSDDSDDTRLEREPIAVAFSEVSDADGLYVLIREFIPDRLSRGRIIKYHMNGEVAWSHVVLGPALLPDEKNFEPEVLLATRSGTVIVAGYGRQAEGLFSEGLFIQSYSSGGIEGWRKDFLFNEAITAPLAIAEALTPDQYYMTGTATFNFGTPPFPLRLNNFANLMFTGAFRISTGARIWHTSTGIMNMKNPFPVGSGYDLEPMDDGVAVLGQLGGSFPGLGARAVLIKYNYDRGDEMWRVERESDYHYHPDVVRNSLAIDGQDLYIGYTSAAGVPTVEKIRDEGILGTPIWSRTEWPLYTTEVRSLNYSVHNQKLYVGVHRSAPLAHFDQNQVQVFSSDNILLATGVIRDGEHIRQLELIRQPEHPGDAAVVFARGDVNSTNCFVERYELKTIWPPFPGEPLESVGHFSSDILDENSWRVEALCHDVEPCVDVPIEAHAMQNGKKIWSKEFTKPTEITLSATGIPTTYGLQMKVNKEYQEVITIDESLFAAGVKGVHIQTDSADQSLTIKSTTDGKMVPFTLSLLNSQGTTIKQYNLEAPDQIVITDKQEQQVARLLFTAPDPLEVNVYPNPSAGEFTVVPSDQKNLETTVSVFTFDGHKIYYEPVKSGEKLLVKIPSAKPGLYVLLVKSGTNERRQLIEIKY